jgi:phenylacetate-CoA ligase
MYPVIYRTARLLWPGGSETRRHLRELERTQWLSKNELQAFQLTRLQQLVKHAYEQVPFYRERYQSAGIHPRDIKSLEDFEALPFLTRQDVLNNLDALIAENYPRSKLYPNETGGSTGEPMRFFLEGSFWWTNAANTFRVRGWHGVREGDKIAWFWGAREDMPEWSWKKRVRSYLMNERYLNAFSMTEQKMSDFARILTKWQPPMFKGYASTLSLFARFVKEHRLPDIRPRYIETTSEKLSGAQRELLEEVFACRVADHYSSREMGTMAYQCEKAGFHVCADVRHLEIVADDRVVQPGQMGEIVVTSLNQFAMPFIRYKNGDMGILDPDRCPCGRGLPILEEIVGRTNDYLVSSDGQFVHSEFFAYLFRVKPEVARYQIYQPDKDHLDVRLVCNQAVGDAWLEAIRAEVQDRFGESIHISVQLVDEIELTPAGKHRYIVSEVEPDFGQPH